SRALSSRIDYSALACSRLRYSRATDHRRWSRAAGISTSAIARLGDEMLERAFGQKPDAAPSALSRVGRLFGSLPVIVFALLSLFFGSAIIFVNPPLRGPDEISHFLRIYSYT